MTTPNNGELGLLTLTFPRRNSFDFLRCVLGTAAFVCSVFAMSYHGGITEAKENENTKVYEILSDLGIAFCIILFPLAMLGRHLLICYLLPKLSGKKCKVFQDWVANSYAIDDVFHNVRVCDGDCDRIRKKDELKMMAFLLSSIILCEGALLAEDNCGVFELALTVFVVQFIKMFPKLGQPYWYDIILVVYIGRRSVMYSMKKMKEKMTRKIEVGAKKEENKLKILDDEWEITNDLLRGHHGINVDKDLPSFTKMRDMIGEMRGETAI